MPVHDRQPQTTSPHMPLRCLHGATLLPCVTLRCYCSATVPHGPPTTPKLASAVIVSSHAQSSYSGGGTALAMLHQEEVLEDDFQTQHTPVRHVRWYGDSGSKASGREGPECTRGSLGQRTVYHLDIGKEEEEMLETVYPTWQTTCWLQLEVQGISNDKVPWYECVTPLTLGAKGMTLLLAKCLLAIWRWSLRVQDWDVCPLTPMVLNSGQFMMQDEVQGDVDNML